MVDYSPAIATAAAPAGVGITALAGGPAVSSSSVAAGKGISTARYSPAATRPIVPSGVPLETTALLDEATASTDRYPVFHLRADWNNTNQFDHVLSDLTPLVEEITVNRETSTELPEAVGIIAGTAAATLEAKLGGTWRPTFDGSIDTDPVKAFSPYRADAELAGGAILNQRIVFDTGMQTEQGPVLMPRMFGTIVGYEPNTAERVVTLRGLDPVAWLRREINQPAWAQLWDVISRWGEQRVPMRINSQWLIDRILRENFYFASPPPGKPLNSGDLVYSATFHGGPLSENEGAYTDLNFTNVFTGTLPNPVPPAWVVGDHPFGMLAPNWNQGISQSVLGIGSQKVVCTAGNGWAGSAWFRFPGTSNFTANARIVTLYPAVGNTTMSMAISIAGRTPRIEVTYTPGPGGPAPVTVYGDLGAAGYVPPVNDQWIFLGWSFNFGTDGFSVTLNWNGTNYTWTATGIGDVGQVVTYYETPYILTVFGGGAGMSVTNVSWYRSNTIPSPDSFVGRTWSPQAKLDPGANNWMGLPELTNEESYGLIKTICDTEAAQFGFEEEGLPYFRSRAVARTYTTSEVLTTEQSLSDLTVSVDTSTVRNVITLTAEAQVGWTAEPIWEAVDVDQIAVDVFGTSTYYLQVPEHCMRLWTPNLDAALVVPGDEFSEASNDPANAGKIVASLSYYDSLHMDGWVQGWDVTFYLQRVSNRWMKLVVHNNIGRGLRFSTYNKYNEAGTVLQTPASPALVIPGRLVKRAPPVTGVVQNTASIATYTRQTYEWGGDDRWRQHFDSGQLIAAAILDWTGRPKPVLAEVDVPHNPRRRLYDQVELRDPDGLGSVVGRIAAIRTTYSADGGARDGLLVRPINPPPGW